MPHPDILDEHESLRRPMMASMALHVSVAAVLLGETWLALRNVEQWGDPNAGGGAVSVNPVQGIPMPGREGRRNPVANDTTSQVPQPPPKAREQVRERAEDPNAVAIGGRKTKKRLSEIAASRQRFRPDPDEKLNQLYSQSGEALVSNMIRTPGGGGVGFGVDAPLGTRFGAYAGELQRRIASKWVTTDVDQRLRTAPLVKVEFTITRSGDIRDVRLSQSSGISALDQSAQRAVYDARPLPPLPGQFERDEARIEIWFELKR